MPNTFVDLTFNLTNNDGNLLPENELFNYLISFRNDDIIDSFESNEMIVDINEHPILNVILHENLDKFRQLLRQSVVKAVISLTTDLTDLPEIEKRKKLFNNRLKLRVLFPTDTSMADLNSQEHEGTVVTFEAKVSNWSKIRTITTKASYQCMSCGEFTIKPYTTKMLDKCSCRGKLEFYKPIESEDTRRIILREIIDDFSEKEMPFTINADIYNQTVREVSLSDKLIVTGIFRSVPLEKESGKITKQFIPTIQVICVRHIANITATQLPDEELMEKFRKLEAENRLVNAVIDGFAYNIYKKRDEKKAIICSLIGSKWVGQVGKGNPPMIHILFVGDPDTYKSTIMKYITNVHDNCVIADSTTVSNAGIKASAVKMDDGRWSIRAGLMPEFNKGVIFLDEFGDLKEDIYADLKAPMIDGRVTKHVAGEDFNAQSETGILASMNPVEGTYNDSKTIYDNLVKLGKPLITRFDLIFKFSKKATEYNSVDIRKHFKKMDLGGKPTEFLTDNEIKLFINYAKTINPTITDSAIETSNQFFVKLEEKNIEKSGTETRTENAVIKVAVALAKWHLSDVVSDSHVQEALDLYASSMGTFGLHFFDGEVLNEISLKKTVDGKREAIRLSYEKLKDENGYVFPDELVRNCGTYGVFKDEGEIKRILESMRLECKLTEKNKMYKISWSI